MIGTKGTSGVRNGRSRSGRFFASIQDPDADQHERQQCADVHQLAQQLNGEESGGETDREPR